MYSQTTMQFLSSLSFQKLFEKHKLNHPTLFLNRYDLVNRSQSGFRKLHSCSTTVSYRYSKWMDTIQAKNTLLLFFLYFYKAFDMVNQDAALRKIESSDIQGDCFTLLSFFLHDRSHTVKVKNSNPSFLPVQSGIPTLAAVIKSCNSACLIKNNRCPSYLSMFPT